MKDEFTLAEYNVQNDSGIKDFNTLYIKTLRCGDEDYVVRINSFNIYPNDLDKKKLDKNSNKYKAIALLKQNRIVTTFNGLILFKAKANNFIYNFEFNNYKGWLSTSSPPFHIKFTLCEQIVLFVEALEQLKTEEKESYERGLICDSIDKLIENITYSFDFYLEILKISYGKKEINSALLLFNINRVLVQKEFNVVKYSEFLTKIESNPEMISKDYIQSFYSVLLYFRLNFEKEKVQSLLNKRDLWKYYIPIIFGNYDYYWNKLDYPDDFIIKILNLSYNSFDELKRTLFLIKTIKKLLVIVNITIDSISNC